jgi:hypothetical protein
MGIDGQKLPSETFDARSNTPITGLVTTLTGILIRNAESYEETAVPDKTFPHALKKT